MPFHAAFKIFIASIEDDEDIDPAIYEDPILMVKWLERRQKIADEEKRGIADNKRVEAE